MDISDNQFDQIIEKAIENIPEIYKKHLQNMAFLVEDEPNDEQRRKLKLHPNETLFGLYEGLPLPQRGGVERLLPDKITIFKLPLLAVSADVDDLQARVNHTIWHEVAHFYGLDHDKIHALEAKHKNY